MPQYNPWELEYQNPTFLTNSDEPQLDFKHFVKWLRKDQKVDLEGLRVLDLGSGTGKNSLFLAERGSDVVGIELSKTAVRISKERAETKELDAHFQTGDIGTTIPYEDANFDVILDVVSSNSLTEAERRVHIKEMKRLLKLGGYIFVKALCKDGDKHALNLIEKFPGTEKDTYIMPITGIIERVFTKEDIETLYIDFKIMRLERKNSYTIFDGKPYRRNFWLVYLQLLS